MAWEFERQFGFMHFFIKDGGLPIKRSACGGWVKGVSEPAGYEDEPARGVCERCLHTHNKEGRIET